MDYVAGWEKMCEDSARRANLTEHMSIHTLNNPYGFRININHPLVLPKWGAFKKSRGLGRYSMTDELRIEFEKIFISSNYYKKIAKEEEKRLGVFYPCISKTEI